jgi:hypothetical protein
MPRSETPARALVGCRRAARQGPQVLALARRARPRVRKAVCGASLGSIQSSAMRTIILTMLFITLIASVVASQQQSPASSNGTQQKTFDRIPPLQEPKSPADWWLVGFTAALFLAALLQFGVMWMHANTLHRTLEATRLIGQAASTLAQSNAVQIRAQLVVQVHHPIQGLQAGHSPRVGLDIFNRGLSPAYACTYETWLAVVPHPFTDFPPNADYVRVSTQSTIYPEHVPVGVAIDLSHNLTQNQMNGIQQNLWRLCFRIRLEYRDAFGNQRFANFAYSANDRAIEPLPNYNDSN